MKHSMGYGNETEKNTCTVVSRSLYNGTYYLYGICDEGYMRAAVQNLERLIFSSSSVHLHQDFTLKKVTKVTVRIYIKCTRWPSIHSETNFLMLCQENTFENDMFVLLCGNTKEYLKQ